MSKQIHLESSMIRINPLPALDQNGPNPCVKEECIDIMMGDPSNQPEAEDNINKCRASLGPTLPRKSESILPLDLLLKVSDVVKDQVQKGEFKTSEIPEPLIPISASALDETAPCHADDQPEKSEVTGSSPNPNCDQCATDSSNEDTFDVSVLFSGNFNVIGLQLYFYKHV